MLYLDPYSQRPKAVRTTHHTNCTGGAFSREEGMLVVETGEGISGANSYIDKAFADSFFRARAEGAFLAITSFADGKDVLAWVGSQRVKEGALIRATDHIDAVFGAHFKSTQLTSEQSLMFPRHDYKYIPAVLKKAAALYALHALQGSLIPKPLGDPYEAEKGITGGLIRKREKIGPIEEEYEYASAKGSSTAYFYESLTPSHYPEADMMLQTLLKTAVIAPEGKDCSPGIVSYGAAVR